jgi:thiol-disulfide isomerase/thioredoxin
LVAFATFSCTSNAQKNRILKALSTTLLATDGSQVSFKNILKYKGKTLVIEVWASWCGIV